MTDNERTVVLLIDYDNLQICYSRDAPGTQLDLGAIVALAQSYGRVVVARAYAEWNLLSERMAVYKAGIEPAFAPVMRPEGSTREGKSLADTVMVSDGVDLLWSLKPDVLVLVTSDKDMIPLARLAKQRGTLVVVLGSDLTAVPLLEMANDFVTYRHLVRELGRPEERLPASRIREEPRLRRARELAPAREVAAALEASARQPRVPQSRLRSRPEPAAVVSAPPLGAVAEPPPLTIPRPAPAPAAAVVETPVGEAESAEDVSPATTARRRRRRGGRGRRVGPAGEEAQPIELTHGEPLEAAEPIEAEAAEAPIEALAEPTVAAAEEAEEPEAEVDTFDAAIEKALSGAVDIVPAWARRLTPRTGQPRVEPPSAEPETAEPEPPAAEAEPVEAPEPVAETPPEPAPSRELKPWERWPERKSENPRSSARIPLRRPEPSEPIAVTTASDASETISAQPPAGSAGEPEQEGAAAASPSGEPLLAAVAEATAPTEPPAAEAAPQPARRTRTRRPRPPKAAEADNGAVETAAGAPLPPPEPAAKPAPARRRRSRRRPGATAEGETSPAAESAD